jgi:anion-transporting  ArsA/GET3 family ATPase
MHPKSEFGKSIHSPSGYAYSCKAVVGERNRRSHARNRHSLNEKHKRRRIERRLSPENIQWVVKRMVQEARRRATIKNIEFSLSAKDIRTPTHCPVFGVELVYQAVGKRTHDSASLDRIDNKLGYIPENVWIISWRANHVKGDATVQELVIVAEAVGKRAAGRLLDGLAHDDLPWDVKP